MNLVVDNKGKISFKLCLEPTKCGKVALKTHRKPKILKTRAAKKIFRRGCGKVGE